MLKLVSSTGPKIKKNSDKNACVGITKTEALHHWITGKFTVFIYQSSCSANTKTLLLLVATIC